MVSRSSTAIIQKLGKPSQQQRMADTPIYGAVSLYNFVNDPSPSCKQIPRDVRNGLPTHTAEIGLVPLLWPHPNIFVDPVDLPRHSTIL